MSTKHTPTRRARRAGLAAAVAALSLLAAAPAYSAPPSLDTGTSPGPAFPVGKKPLPFSGAPTVGPAETFPLPGLMPPPAAAE